MAIETNPKPAKKRLTFEPGSNGITINEPASKVVTPGPKELGKKSVQLGAGCSYQGFITEDSNLNMLTQTHLEAGHHAASKTIEDFSVGPSIKAQSNKGHTHMSKGGGRFAIELTEPPAAKAASNAGTMLPILDPSSIREAMTGAIQLAVRDEMKAWLGQSPGTRLSASRKRKATNNDRRFECG